MSILSRSITLGLGLSVVALGFSQSAWAVPSFARQTGLACAACHTTYPELTSFGRLFKLNGYTLTGLQQVQSSGGGGLPELKINEIPPFSAMFQTSVSHMNKALPPSATGKSQNNNVEFPQQMSFFFAGEMSPHMGSFIQFTYDHQQDHFSIDNTDIRYANQAMGGDLIYGFDMNNNPSVEDPWQSTPAWGFPFASSDLTQGPVAPLVDGTFAQQVAGLGAYAMWNNLIYGDFTLYRSEQQGATQPYLVGPGANSIISGVAPYWRLALQHNFGNNYLEIGTYGMAADMTPPSGVTLYSGHDKYLDLALDAQYERNFGEDNLVVRTTYIHEKQSLDASQAGGLASNSSNTLNTFRINGTYHLGDKSGLSLGYFNTSGSSDATLYSPANGFAGNPDTRGYIVQATYLPWQNIQFGVQYTGYTKFNGASSNYDGAGRNASDNNLLYVYGWFMW